MEAGFGEEEAYTVDIVMHPVSNALSTQRNGVRYVSDLIWLQPLNCAIEIIAFIAQLGIAGKHAACRL